MLFKKFTSSPPQQSKQGYTPPVRTQTKGDRQLAARVGDVEPEHRKKGVTLSCRNKVGLTNNVVLEREPRGCLFKVQKFGFFDLDGYWITIKGGFKDGKNRSYSYEVRRGAPRKINRLLSESQKKELARVRLNARRRGVR